MIIQYLKRFWRPAFVSTFCSKRDRGRPARSICVTQGIPPLSDSREPRFVLRVCTSVEVKLSGSLLLNTADTQIPPGSAKPSRRAAIIRDLADGDIVAWIDERLAGVDPVPASDRPARLRQALLEPLGNIYGVSNKVLAMSLAELLLGGDAKRPIWIEAGTVMIAIDTLVHNFLHRTGILRDLRAEHLYGPGCYAPAGCAAIIERIAGRIDARRFNPAYPANFPRFVQHAIWQFCAESGLNRCNGRRIDDRARCEQTDCPVFASCARVPLKPA